MTRSIHSLEEQGLFRLVGNYFNVVYASNMVLDYSSIVSKFGEVAKEVPFPYRELFQLFNPKSSRTEEFISDVRGYSHLTLRSLVAAIQQGSSFPSDVIARGIMSTRLNLPPPVYQALEERYLSIWESWRDRSKLSGGARDYAQTVFKASERYRKALRLVEAALMRAPPNLVALPIK